MGLVSECRRSSEFKGCAAESLVTSTRLTARVLLGSALLVVALQCSLQAHYGNNEPMDDDGDCPQLPAVLIYIAYPQESPHACEVNPSIDESASCPVLCIPDR
jgi:hypothetical protein